MYSKDTTNIVYGTTILIVLLWFNIVHYSSLYQYFLLINYCPYNS